MALADWSGRRLGRFPRPLHDITAAARRASGRHLGERINLHGPEDELKELADTFDDMLERLDSAFASQRQFVANASHELRTPLTSMRTAIDVVLAKPNHTAEQLEATAERVRRSVDRAEQIVEALLTLAVSNRGDGALEPFDLTVATEDALDEVSDRARAEGLRVDSELAAWRCWAARYSSNAWSGTVENAVVYNVPDGVDPSPGGSNWARLPRGGQQRPRRRRGRAAAPLRAVPTGRRAGRRRASAWAFPSSSPSVRRTTPRSTLWRPRAGA